MSKVQIGVTPTPDGMILEYPMSEGVTIRFAVPLELMIQQLKEIQKMRNKMSVPTWEKLPGDAWSKNE